MDLPQAPVSLCRTSTARQEAASGLLPVNTDLPEDSDQDLRPASMELQVLVATMDTTMETVKVDIVMEVLEDIIMETVKVDTAMEATVVETALVAWETPTSLHHQLPK